MMAIRKKNGSRDVGGNPGISIRRTSGRKSTLKQVL
jgi:hypothetical protein